MEDLTKQQLILLTILASFITSIATSITIVSILTDTTPIITQTINRIVEKTVETVSPSAPVEKKNPTASPVVAGENDQLIASVQRNLAIIATISKKTSDDDAAVVYGNGFLASGGLLVTDAEVLQSETDGFVVALKNDKEYSATVVWMDEKNDIALLQLHDENKAAPTLRSASFFEGALSLGQTVLALGGKTGSVLAKGILTELPVSNTGTSTEAVSPLLGTTIALSKIDRGGPLFNLSGEVIGATVTSSAGEQYFIPISSVVSTINAYTKAQNKGVGSN